jgi:hypothetical protein
MAHQFDSVRHLLQQEIIRAAESDPSFRRRLIDSPRAALEAALGVELPQAMGVTVLEERVDQLYVVLPVDLSGIAASAAVAASGDVGPDGHHRPSLVR